MCLILTLIGKNLDRKIFWKKINFYLQNPIILATFATQIGNKTLLIN